MWTGNCTRSFSTEWGLPKSAGLCPWMSTRVNDVDVFKSSERNLVLSHSLHGYLVYSCLLLLSSWFFAILSVDLNMLKSWEPPTQQNSQDSATRVATGDHMGRMDPGDSSSLRCAEQTRSKWLMTHVCCNKIQNLIIGLGNLPLNHSAESAEPNRDINDWRVEVKKNTRSIKASIVWALGLLAQSHSSVQHISYDFIITSSSLHITSSILHRYQFGHQLDIQWDHPRGSALQLIQSLANQMPILEGPNLSRPNVSSQTQKSQKVKLQKH